MKVFIALYRGINVGGRNAVRMEALRALHERLGHQGVKSYIQSGNIVLGADGSEDAIGRKLAAAFVEEFGFAAKVVVVGGKRLSTIVEDNPFAEPAIENPKTVHAGFCEGELSEKGLTALLAKHGGTESFVIKDGIVYLHAPDGFGTSKFAAGMEKACGVPMTVRNWKTMDSLWKMVREIQ